MKRSVALVVVPAVLILLSGLFQLSPPPGVWAERLNERIEFFRHPSSAGTFRGRVVDDQMAVFEGIRYGRANRWEAAVMEEPHMVVTVNATAPGFSCPQHVNAWSAKLPQNEDCLFLNVYTPVSALTAYPAAPVPVMVFIHGGGFVFGSASDPFIGGEGLTPEGVVLVTMNYRLGPFGFLSMPELPDTNFGLGDQLLALRWVQRHIRSFGGDPRRVTLFGQSAGGMSALWLATNAAVVEASLADRERLFDAVILQSASVPVLYTSEADAHLAAAEFAEALGCAAAADRLACMRAVDTESLSDSYENLFRHRDVFPHTGVPVHIKGIASPHPHGPWVYPSDALAAGSLDPRVRFMVGTTAHEFYLMITSVFPFLEPETELIEPLLRSAFEHHMDEEEIHHLLHHYHITTDESTRTSTRLASVANDLYMQCYTRNLALELNHVSSHPVYKYIYDHEAINGIQGFGAFHGAELPFVFGTTPGGMLFPNLFTEEERALSKEMTSAWASFAKQAESPRVGWPAFESHNEESLVFSPQPHLVRHYKQELCQFWEKIYPRMELRFTEGDDEMVHESMLSLIVNRYFFRLMIYISRLTIWTLITACVSLFAVLLFTCYRCCCRRPPRLASSSATNPSHAKQAKKNTKSKKKKRD